MKLKENYIIHDELNSNLWTSENKLKEDVRFNILKIVDIFKNNSDIDIDILDIIIVGSNAAYNYSEKSDIDVHIISNFESYGCDKEILQAYFNAYKTNFNKSYDFKVKDNKIELYVEDVMTTVISNGIYSVLSDTWIKFPNKDYYPKDEINISKELYKFKLEILKALDSNDYEIINTLINKLYLIRKNSLSVDGEFGKGNLIFKEIRNLGLLDTLKDRLKEIKSKELTLENLTEGMFIQRYDKL